MVTVLCFVEVYDSKVEEWISGYDDDEHVIQLYDDIVKSSENNLFFCLGEIATQLFQTSGEVWFVTDHEELYGWVNDYYYMFFNDVVLVEKKNAARFDCDVDIQGLIDYESQLVFDNKEQDLLGRICALIDNTNYAILWNENVDLCDYYLEKRGKDLIWLHMCLLILRRISDREGRLEETQKHFELSLLYYICFLETTPSRLNTYLTKALDSDILNASQLYYIWNQIKALSLRDMLKKDEESNRLLLRLYKRAYLAYKDALREELVPLALQERTDNSVMVMTIQVLGSNHAPTKTVKERCETLQKMGKEVYLINTREQLTKKGELPYALKYVGNLAKQYSTLSTFAVSETVDVKFYQPDVDMPDIDEIKKIIKMIREHKPQYILSIGTGSMVADLCNCVVPVFPMALAFSTLPVSMCKTKIIGRTLTGEERQNSPDIIESRFTFRLNPQQHEYTREMYQIPQDRFVMVVVGIRLDYEVSDDFCKMLEQVVQRGGYVVFAGRFEQYPKVCQRHPELKENSSFIGYCEDMLALMEICDLYVNPNRLGGGFSVIEAFAKGVPGVYLRTGDVYIAGGELFGVADYDEMRDAILRYMEDTAYYREMSDKARERAELMTDSVAAMQDLDAKIRATLM